jgi:hypothetical protein
MKYYEQTPTFLGGNKDKAAEMQRRLYIMNMQNSAQAATMSQSGEK